MRKKEEKREKGIGEKGKRKKRKCGARILFGEGAENEIERSILRIKKFVPNGENKGNNDCLLTTVKELN